MHGQARSARLASERSERMPKANKRTGIFAECLRNVCGKNEHGSVVPWSRLCCGCALVLAYFGRSSVAPVLWLCAGYGVSIGSVASAIFGAIYSRVAAPERRAEEQPPRTEPSGAGTERVRRVYG